VTRLLVLALAVLTAACRLGDDRPDVVLIVLDAARADHLSPYGYARPTTPHLDALAAEGVRYTHAIANGTWTVPGHAALFTGRLPLSHGAYHAPNAYAVSAINPDVPTLAEQLATAGYDTAAFVGNETYLTPRLGFGRGFALYRTDEVRPAARLAHHVTRWIHRHAGDPMFLFLNVLDPHEPYRARAPYDVLFPGRMEGLGDVSGQYHATGHVPGTDVLGHCISQYDGELRYVDDQLGRIFDQLRAEGRWDDALVVVTADHGELFGEHGHLGHGGVPWDALVHIPLLVKYPGGQPRGVEDRPVSLVDVAATVLDVAGIPREPGLQGRPLQTPAGVAVSEEITPEGRVHRAVYDGSDRVLLEQVADDGLVLFDLRSDPGQLHPLPATHGDAARLHAIRAAAMAQAPVPPGPILVPDAGFLERLRALGYAH
jgi:arylsulfatase A-like enzyme